MQLREATIEMSYEQLGLDILSSHRVMPFFCNSVGGFDPNDFTVHGERLPAPPMDRDGHVYIDNVLQRLRREVAKRPTPGTKLQYLLRSTVMFHEIRHFHDYFCTPLGHSLFTLDMQYYLRLLSKFGSILAGSNLGKLPKPPFRELIRQGLRSPHAVDPGVRELLDAYIEMTVARVVYVGDWPVKAVAPDYADFELVWLHCTSISGHSVNLPCFPTLVQSNPPVAALLPIGFRALTEALAKITQDAVILSFGRDLVELQNERLRRFPEYVVLNMFIARLYENRGTSICSSKGRDPLDVLFRVVSACLNSCVQSFTEESVPLPGGVFVEQIRSLPWDRGINCAELDSGQTERIKILTEAARRRIGRVSEAEVEGRPEFLMVLEKFVLNHLLVPALETFSTTGDTQDESLESLTGYILGQHRLPLPPVFCGSGQVFIPPSLMPVLDSLVARAMFGWTAMRELFLQLFTSDQLVCPVLLRDRYRLFDSAQMRPHAFCPATGLLDVCGRLQFRQESGVHPDCDWLGCLSKWQVIDRNRMRAVPNPTWGLGSELHRSNL